MSHAAGASADRQSRLRRRSAVLARLTSAGPGIVRFHSQYLLKRDKNIIHKKYAQRALIKNLNPSIQRINEPAGRTKFGRTLTGRITQ